MIINYSFLLTFDGSHVSAFDLEAMCAWHMKHILQKWFITELFFCLFPKKRAAPGRAALMVTAILIVGVRLWLQTGSEKSENSEYILFSKPRNPFVCSLQLNIIPKNLTLLKKKNFFFFSGKRWAKHYWIWESFLKVGWGVIGERLSCNPRLVWEAAGLQGLWCNMIGRGERLRADGGFFSLDRCGARGLEHKDSAWFFC